MRSPRSPRSSTGSSSAGDVTVFCVSALALVPLAWLIGEATEQAAEHTGSGIGGFLNASFGNAPELIIALFAIGDGLPDVVRGSITGSIVSNLLLVLGFALVATDEEDLNRRSLVSNLGLVVWASLLFLVPSVPGWHGDPDRHSLAIATIPVAVVLLLFYFGADVGATFGSTVDDHRTAAAKTPPAADAGACGTRSSCSPSRPASTAVVSEILVAHARGRSPTRSVCRSSSSAP